MFFFIFVTSFLSCQKENIDTFKNVQDDGLVNLENRSDKFSNKKDLRLSQKIARIAFNHEMYFSDQNPEGYFLKSSLVDGYDRSYESLPDIETSVTKLEKIGLLDNKEQLVLVKRLNELSSAFKSSSTVGQLRSEFNLLRNEVNKDVKNNEISKEIGEFLQSMVSLSDTSVVTGILHEMALESESESNLTLEERMSDCILGRTTSCWGQALVKAGINFVATSAGTAGAGILVASTGGAGLAASSILKAAIKKGISTLLVSVLGNFIDPSCSCDMDTHPCSSILGVFAIDPESLNCSEDSDVMRVRIKGIELVQNYTATWSFLNCERVENPGIPSIVSSLPYMDIRQVDTTKPVHISALVSFTEPGSEPKDDNNCEFLIQSPDPDEASEWAWNISSINSDPGQVIIDGPLVVDATSTGLPSLPKTYTANGIFREIASTTDFVLESNFCGSDSPSSNGDPYSIDVIWNTAGSSGSFGSGPKVYSTSFNYCGSSAPSSININLITR